MHDAAVVCCRASGAPSRTHEPSIESKQQVPAIKVVVECDVDDDKARVPVEGDHLIVRTLHRGTPAQLESGAYTSRDSAEGLQLLLAQVEHASYRIGAYEGAELIVGNLKLQITRRIGRDTQFELELKVLDQLGALHAVQQRRAQLEERGEAAICSKWLGEGRRRWASCGGDDLGNVRRGGVGSCVCVYQQVALDG